VWLTPEERTAVTLWVLHCYVFDRFNVTPRLALLSPVRGCGKTTLLKLLEMLVPNAALADNVTAAALYRILNMPLSTPTLLLDEGDNLGLLDNRDLRAVMNAGHRRGGKVWRAGGKMGIRKYDVVAPLAVAAIGTLPLPLTQRCIVIDMHRPDPDASLERLNELNPEFQQAMLMLVAELQRWAASCQLNSDPDMAELRLRVADNWRVLFAIADDLGRGALARRAARALSGRQEEDPSVLTLVAIRETFDAHGVDRISSAVLVEVLHAMEVGMWEDWRGPRDDQQPHRITQNELARLLRGFKIHPRTVWPPGGRQQRGPSSKGYYRRDFEDAWARFCKPAGTAAHRHTPPPAQLPPPTAA
jgi:hypothetical protein